MNKTTLLLIITILLTAVSSSCAQSRVAKDQFEVDNFTSIKSSVVANINISQSSQTTVVAEGDENLLDILEVRMDNNRLILTMEERQAKRFNKKASKLTITISTPTLTHIDSEGVGNIQFVGTFDTPELIINSEGVGNIRADNLQAGFVKAESEGVGNITLIGKADEVEINSEGVGNIDVSELISLRAKVESEGVGNVRCHATEFLKAKSEGIGNITYYGNPKQTDLSKEGIGKIKAGK